MPLSCSNAAAVSGRNELLQYQKLLSSQYQPPHNTSQVCSYTVGELGVENESCLSFDIAQSCPTASPNQPPGGTTFRIEARGEELKLCTVTDMFTAWAVPRQLRASEGWMCRRERRAGLRALPGVCQCASWWLQHRVHVW